MAKNIGKVERISTVAVTDLDYSDAEIRMLYAFRPNGRVTLPGGKREDKLSGAEMAAIELFQETGARISPTLLIPSTSGVQMFVLDGVNHYVQRYLALEILLQTDAFLQREPEKHGPWFWATESEVANWVTRGKLDKRFLGDFGVARRIKASPGEILGKEVEFALHPSGLGWMHERELRRDARKEFEAYLKQHPKFASYFK